MLAIGFTAIIIAKLGMMELTLEEKYTVVTWRTFGSVAVDTFFRSCYSYVISLKMAPLY